MTKKKKSLESFEYLTYTNFRTVKKKKKKDKSKNLKNSCKGIKRYTFTRNAIIRSILDFRGVQEPLVGFESVFLVTHVRGHRS